jgi:hypothetical protein
LQGNEDAEELAGYGYIKFSGLDGEAMGRAFGGLYASIADWIEDVLTEQIGQGDFTEKEDRRQRRAFLCALIRWELLSDLQVALQRIGYPWAYYTLGGILPSDYLYGLTAKQGSGKTALMIAAALAVAFGREDILGCPVERGRVAYVTIENPVDFKMKLAVNCYVHNISYDEAETRIAIIDGRDTPEQIFEGLRLDAEANGGFQLVCVDTFQAGFAAANAGAFNDNEAVLGYLIRLRPLTTLPGSPSGLVAFHPTKNAGEGELIPYGGGSTYNEVDGNLTLWKDGTIKLHHNRLRGPEFEPRFFRIEQLSCPDIVDKGGRQILLPVLRPTTAIDVEEQAIIKSATDIKLLQAMLDAPNDKQRDWAQTIGLAVSTVNDKLGAFYKQKLVDKILDNYFLTERAKKLLKSKA